MALSDVTLKNATYEVRLESSQGYVVKFMRRNGGVNVADAYDEGRNCFHTSVYGSSTYGEWNGVPWQFNPLQCGDWRTGSASPKILGQKTISASQHSSSIVPMEWASGEHLPGWQFDQNIQLFGGVIIHRGRVRWNGTGQLAALGPQAPRHQELSAHFLNRKYGTYRTGNGVVRAVAQIEKSGNTYSDVVNGWCAMTDSAGYGVWWLTTKPVVTHYVVKTVGAISSTAYLAHLDTFALTPGMDVSFETQAVIGSRKQAEAAFGRALV